MVAGNDGQFRRLADALGVPSWPTTTRFATVGERNENREELRPLLLEALSAEQSRPGVVRRPHRRRPPLRPDQRPCAAGSSWPRSSASSRSSRPVGDPDRPQPDPVERRHRPATTCRRRASTTTAPRSAPGSASPTATRTRRRAARAVGLTRSTACPPRRAAPEFPTVARHLRRYVDHAARPRPRRGPDGQGDLRRAGLLARSRSSARPRSRPGSSRPSCSASPTTASPRPPSRPG